MSRTRGTPSDKEENMAYNDNYRSLSENALERDGIILRAEGSELQFYALAGKVATSDGSELMEDMQYTLTSIAERSELDIEQIGDEDKERFTAQNEALSICFAEGNRYLAMLSSENSGFLGIFTMPFPS